MTQPESYLPQLVTDESEPLKERVSTWLDTVGMVGVGAGVGWGLFSVIGPYAVAIGGVIVIVLNLAAGMLRRPPRVEAEPVEPTPLRAIPGPTDPGNLHVSGR